MFFKYKSKDEIDKFLKNYYDNQLEYTNRLLDVEMERKKARCQKMIAKEWKEYEHDYHSGMEERKVTLAKLDAEIEFKEKLVKERDLLLEEKNKTISLLTDLLKVFVSGNDKPITTEKKDV